MLIRETRDAWHRLSRQPGYALLSVTILGVGLGVALFLFSLLNTLVIAPLPFPQPQRLLAIGEVQQASGRVGDNGTGVGDADSDQYLALSGALDLADRIGAYQKVTSVLDTGQGAALYDGGRFTAGLFDLLGVRPILGRGLQPGDERPGAPRVVVLAESLWRHQLAADSAVIGKAVRVDGEWATVVGVLPAAFGFPGSAAFWLPLTLRPGDHDTLAIVARRADTTTLDALRQQLVALQPQLDRLLPQGGHRGRLVAKPLAASLVPEDLQRWVWLMFGAGVLVLLLAVFNVANLQAVQVLRRQRELALRAALGAGRGRLLLGACIESLLLALVALAIALALTHYGNRWLVQTYADSQQTPSSYLHFGLDPRVLAAGLCMALASMLMAAGPPTWRASRQRLSATLGDGGKGSGGGLVRAVRVLVTTELVLTVVLLVGAGTFVQALQRLLQQPLAGAGYATQVLTARIALPDARYPRDGERITFFQRLAEQLAQQPGVIAASIANTVPGAMLGSHESIATPGQSEPVDGWQRAQMGIVDPGFLAVYGVHLREGRFFRRDDDGAHDAVTVVDARLAEQLWPGRDALGQTVRLWPGRPAEQRLRVIGVVEPLQLDSQLERARPGLLLPLAQAVGQGPLRRGMSVSLRLHGDADGALRQLIRQVHALDDQAAVYDVNSQQRAIAVRRTGFLVLTEVFSLLGTVALLLAAAGLYGVLSLSVALRTRELGIRRAIGAGGPAITRDVCRPLLWQLGIGLGLGSLLALPWSRLIADANLGTRAHDPLVFGGVLALVATVALAAVLAPLRRALRVEPLEALRDD